MLARAIPRSRLFAHQNNEILRSRAQPRHPNATSHQSSRMSSQSKGNSDPHQKFDQSSNAQDANASHPTFNLKDLGASPTARIVVYTALGIIATAESVFWTMWLWEKMAPKSQAQAGDDATDEEPKGNTENNVKVKKDMNEKV